MTVHCLLCICTSMLTIGTWRKRPLRFGGQVGLRVPRPFPKAVEALSLSIASSSGALPWRRRYVVLAPIRPAHALESTGLALDKLCLHVLEDRRGADHLAARRIHHRQRLLVVRCRRRNAVLD